MSGLPKLPGFNFCDPTLSKFHLSHTFDYCNGYRLPKLQMPGIGERELDINGVAYVQRLDPVRYDPSLTYGRTRSVALPQYLPHYALYDQKCLLFKAFFKQSVAESPLEYYRVRQVNIVYFLQDDTMTVMEPRVNNSGLDQGRLVKRGKIPKTTIGDYWHWKDLQVGKDIALFGVVYHTVDCDSFTREFLQSQGLIMADAEAMPPDPYTQLRELQVRPSTYITPASDDKLRRFLEYDGKVLSFDAVWDTREEENGELRNYKILYFLADDTISVKEMHERNSGRDPFPMLLKKRKLPKIWTDRPETYPAAFMELSDAEVTEYYQPRDLKVGETIFVLGRRMLLFDCDPFSRNYYKKALCMEQKPRIELREPPKPTPPKPMPPHDGIGTLEDSLQNTITFLPKAPRKDVIRQLYNAGKYLRYIMKLDTAHPEDTIRRFLLRYSLSDGTVYIYEPPIRNSGIWGGKYLRNTLLMKPGANPVDPDFYTPVDFYMGAIINIFGQRFIIIDCDLYVYRYMQANPEKFPCEVIENIRNFMYNKGCLKDDVESRMEVEIQDQKKAARDAICDEGPPKKSEYEKCMEALRGSGTDPEYERALRADLVDQYEASLKHTFVVPEHGIQSVNLECAYPIVIGKKPDLVCRESDLSPEAYTPKHVDTPEEIEQKYYTKVLQDHHGICEHGKPVVCDKAVNLTRPTPDKKLHPEPFEAIMINPVEEPSTACRSKGVTFAEGDARCMQDKYDLCNLKNSKAPCDCTPYTEKC